MMAFRTLKGHFNDNIKKDNMDNVIYVTFQLTQHFRFSILNYLIRSLHCYKKNQSGFREGRLLNVFVVFEFPVLDSH